MSLRIYLKIVIDQLILRNADRGNAVETCFER